MFPDSAFPVNMDHSLYIVCFCKLVPFQAKFFFFFLNDNVVEVRTSGKVIEPPVFLLLSVSI